MFPGMLRASLGLLTLLTLVPAVGRADGPGAGDASELRDYYSANGLLNRGLTELAAVEYRKFLDEHGDHAKAPVARYGLAVCLCRMEQPVAAARELVPLVALRDFEFAGEAAVLLGQCRLAGGEFDAAARVLDEMLTARPSHALAADALALLVEALYRADKFQAVEQKAAVFIERWPTHAAHERVMLFRALALMGRSEWASAAERLTELLRAAPAGPLAEQAELRLAQCHERRGADDEAGRAYQVVLQREKGQYAPDAHLALAGIALRKNSPRDAVPLLERLLKDVPESPLRCAAVILRARAALALEQPQDALAVLKDVGARCAESADQVAYWLAKAELRSGAAAAAAQRLAEALEKHPQSPLVAEMRYDRAAALAQLGDDAAAARAIEEFLAQHAQHGMTPEALYLLATLECRQERYAPSAALARSLLERFPKHPRTAAAEFLVAESLLLGKHDAEAATAYQRFLEGHPDDPQAPAATFRLGTVLYRLGRFEDAVAPLTRAAEQIGQHPEFRDSLLLLGDGCLQRGEWKTAETWLAKYLATPDAPAADEALLKLGLARARQGSSEAALGTFDELLAKHTESGYRVQALFERGQALLALGRADEAATAFERVLADDAAGDFKPYALSHLGAIALQRKDFTAAAERFAGAAGRAPNDDAAAAALLQQGQALLAAEQYADAEAALAAVVQRFPANDRVGVARAQLALALARQDKPAAALRLIEQVEQSGGASDESLKSGLQYEKAWCQRKLGQTDAAAMTYRALLKDGGGSQRVYAALELAELLAGQGQCEEALKLLQPVRATASDFGALNADAQARALYRIGTCAFEAGRNEEVLAALEEMLKGAPQHALAGSAEFFCGEVCFKLNRLPAAVEHLTRVVEGHQKDDVYGPSLLRLGECLAGLQRWQRSEEVFTQHLREFPADSQWYQAQFGVAWARENLGRHDEALAAYRPIVERHKGPTAARAQFQIGECLYAQKKFQEAVTEFLKVDILYGYAEWSAAALYEAGRCLEELGQVATARQQFTAVREKYGATRWAELAAQRLAASTPTGLPGRGR